MYGGDHIKGLRPCLCDVYGCPNVVRKPTGGFGHKWTMPEFAKKIAALKGMGPPGLVSFLLGGAELVHIFEVRAGLSIMPWVALPQVRFQGEVDEGHLQSLARDLILSEGVEGALSFVRSVVVTGGMLEGDQVQKLREKRLEDFGATVFTTIAPKERPIRGPFGEATIELKPGSEPVKQRRFQIHGEREVALKKLVEGLIADGKLEQGRSAWSSPAFPVPKKKPGEYRLVVDYRALNDVTVNDGHPLPRIEDILQRQGQYKLWSVLDMKDGYHQVPLKKEHRHLTCMTTPVGSLQWTVLVMGLKNGGAIFQRMMEWCLEGIECADVYIDDVIVGSTGETFEECLAQHDRDIRRVLARLAEHKLIVDPRKAKLFTAEVEFCGHILREGKREPAPGKLLSIQKWELPKTVTQLRGFLGLTNYYSSYVPRYAEFAGSLMGKLQVSREDGRKGSTKPIVWKDSEKQDFLRLKGELAKHLELFRVRPDEPFVMRTDASDKAIGAVLEQHREVSPGKVELVPVAFMSRKLGKSQLNWTPREKETYAVVSALTKWAGWVGLQPILILTDHKSLEDWVHEKMDTPSGPAGRRARWHETLSKFDLAVKYLPGKDNVVADCMSRFAYPACKAFQDTSFHGSEEARLEMKKIIARRGGRRPHGGVDFHQHPPRGGKLVLVGGSVNRRHLIPEDRVFVITRSGRGGRRGQNRWNLPAPKGQMCNLKCGFLIPRQTKKIFMCKKFWNTANAWVWCHPTLWGQCRGGVLQPRAMIREGEWATPHRRRMIHGPRRTAKVHIGVHGGWQRK